MADRPDMEIRDPNSLNDYVKVMFEDVIGEPEGAHSADCIWRCSYNCFNASKRCCYLLLTGLCAIPCALCWGCQFGCLSFCHIWNITPNLKACEINLGCCQKAYGFIINCLCAPCCEACALCFSKVRVTNG